MGNKKKFKVLIRADTSRGNYFGSSMGGSYWPLEAFYILRKGLYASITKGAYFGDWRGNLRFVVRGDVSKKVYRDQTF